MCGSIVLHTWVIDIWNNLSSDIVNASSISAFKHKLEFVDFTALCVWSLRTGLCVSLFSYFLLLGMRQCLLGPVSRLLFK